MLSLKVITPSKPKQTKPDESSWGSPTPLRVRMRLGLKRLLSRYFVLSTQLFLFKIKVGNLFLLRSKTSGRGHNNLNFVSNRQDPNL